MARWRLERIAERSSAWQPCSELDCDLVADFLRDGFIVLRGFFSPDEMAKYHAAARTCFEEDGEREISGRSLGRVALERTARLWQRSHVLSALTFDERLARAACDLLHVEGVRVIGDDIFCKPARGRVTSWHADEMFVPIDRTQFVSAWIPFAPVTRGCGAMVYASGTHRTSFARPRGIFAGETLSHLWYLAQLRGDGRQLHTIEAQPGDVLMHHGRTMHMGCSNASGKPRLAFGIHYVDVHSRFVLPLNSMQEAHVTESSWDTLRPGDEIDVDAAPIAFSR